MPQQYDRLAGEAAQFAPGCECSSPVAPSDFDRLVSGYRLTQTALLGQPCCGGGLGSVVSIGAGVGGGRG